ncbi:hypothetical protein V8E55_011640 [Tylopilus felleus]
MFAKLSVLALCVSFALAKLTLTAPGFVQVAHTADIDTSVDATDPHNIDLQLLAADFSGSAWLAQNTGVAAIIEVTIPEISPGNYSVLATKVNEPTAVLAQSNYFLVFPA